MSRSGISSPYKLLLLTVRIYTQNQSKPTRDYVMNQCRFIRAITGWQGRYQGQHCQEQSEDQDYEAKAKVRVNAGPKPGL